MTIDITPLVFAVSLLNYFWLARAVFKGEWLEAIFWILVVTYLFRN